jgi:ATP-dependent Clp protease protease subunit
MSPVSMMMIHNPMTVAFGDSAEMQKAIEMLGSVKDSIINAYEIKTGLSRTKLSHLMDAETWMDANKAVELGFADEIMQSVLPRTKWMCHRSSMLLFQSKCGQFTDG